MKIDYCTCLSKILYYPSLFEKAKEFAYHVGLNLISSYMRNGIEPRQIKCWLKDRDGRDVIAMVTRHKSGPRRVILLKAKLVKYANADLYTIEEPLWAVGIRKTDFMKLCREIMAKVKAVEA